MGIGKLYNANDEQLISEVDYKFQDVSLTSWWGELTLMDYKRISDGGGYILEIDDKRRGKIYLKKRVNRAVSGVPPRYIYHFSGSGPLEQEPEEPEKG